MNSLDKCDHENLLVDPMWKSTVDVSISWFDCSNDLLQSFQNMGVPKRQNGTPSPEATPQTMQPLTRPYSGSWEEISADTSSPCLLAFPLDVNLNKEEIISEKMVKAGKHDPINVDRTKRSLHSIPLLWGKSGIFSHACWLAHSQEKFLPLP